jgi:hypothetical protein
MEWPSKFQPEYLIKEFLKWKHPSMILSEAELPVLFIPLL